MSTCLPNSLPKLLCRVITSIRRLISWLVEDADNFTPACTHASCPESNILMSHFPTQVPHLHPPAAAVDGPRPLPRQRPCLPGIEATSFADSCTSACSQHETPLAHAIASREQKGRKYAALCFFSSVLVKQAITYLVHSSLGILGFHAHIVVRERTPPSRHTRMCKRAACSPPPPPLPHTHTHTPSL